MRVVMILGIVIGLTACGGGGSNPGGVAGGPRGSQSLFFDGVDDLVTITKSDHFLLSGGITIEAWIRPETLTANPDYAGIVKAGTHILSLDNTLGLRDQTAFLQTISTPSTENVESPLNTLMAGVWQHVAGTYDGTTIRIYWNGTLVGEKSHPGVPNGLSTVLIGSWSTSFHGAIDEVRIWSMARTAQEITGAMDQVLTGSEAGLLAYYRFEGTGQEVTDSASGGAHGSLGTDGTSETTDPVRTPN